MGKGSEDKVPYRSGWLESGDIQQLATAMESEEGSQVRAFRDHTGFPSGKEGAEFTGLLKPHPAKRGSGNSPTENQYCLSKGEMDCWAINPSIYC